MALVGFDDTLHQRVADHILGLEMGEADAGDVLQDLDHVLEAGAGAAGRSTWVTSPVITAVEPKPIR